MSDDDLMELQIYCNSCRQQTNHKEQFRQKKIYRDERDGFTEVLIHSLWMCMGCEQFALRKTYWNETMSDDEAEHEFFPKRAHSELAPKPYTKLKPKLSALYAEAITCYNHKAQILCAAGLRALLEGICQDKRIKGTNLKTKIDGLQAVLPNKNIVRNLHQFRFMGNEAVHELAAPKPAELALAISILEDLLSFLYELDYKASQLREMRRTKKKRKSKPKAVPATGVTITQIT